MRQGMNTALIAAAAVVLSAAHYAPAPANEPLQGVVKASGITAPKVIGRSEARSGIPQRAEPIKTTKCEYCCCIFVRDALRLWRQFQHKGMKGAMLDVKFVIALAPDPIHTHLSGYFDRTMDAIQAAAQDEQYVYDSSWLPWKEETKSFPLRSDAETKRQRSRRRKAVRGCFCSVVRRTARLLASHILVASCVCGRGRTDQRGQSG